MDPYDAIEKRYGAAVSPAYREMREQGCFDVLQLTDLEWLSPAEIAAYKFEDWQLAHDGGFVPFAVSARRDEWCWRLDWAVDEEPPVVFCERGPEGFGFAPNLRGFLYRALLEELSGTWLLQNDRDEKGKATVRRSIEVVLPHLPAVWGARLKELATRTWRTDEKGTICVFPRAECNAIVNEELAFTCLNETFVQEKS